MIKKAIHILFLLLSSAIYSQNRISYSQYMVNQGVFNPGFFNSEYQLSGNIYYRKQWIGIQGAPTTKSFAANYNIGDAHGLKLNFYQDDITVFKDLNFGLGYNWRTFTGESAMLSFGVLVDYGMYSAALGGVSTKVANDPAFTSLSSSYLNFGSGVYWESSNVFMGLSAPHLFNNSKNAGLINPDVLFNHIYYTLGARFGDFKMQFFPTTLVKYVLGSPLQFDVNANFLYNYKFWYGIGYRNDNTIIPAVGMVLFEGLKLIYSYDIAVLANTSHSSGSHEVTLGYSTSFYSGDQFGKRKYLTKRYNYKKQ